MYISVQVCMCVHACVCVRVYACGFIVRVRTHYTCGSIVGYSSSEYICNTNQNTMYCGGEPEHHVPNVISLIAHKHLSCTCHESNF